MSRRLLYDDVLVMGTNHKADNCQYFIEYIINNPNVLIQSECYNEPAGGDPFAQAIYMETKLKAGFLRSERKDFHIGYLPKKMAFALGADGSKLNKGEMIDIELAEYGYDGNGQYPYTFIVNVYAF